MDERSAYVRQFWNERGKRIEDPRLATRFRVNDAVRYDLELALSFCGEDSEVLDLGSGTCVLSRLLAPHVKSIAAVDFVHDLLRKEPLPANITPIVSDVRTFRANKQFDLVLLFGVLTYIFDEAEVLSIYRNVGGMLAPGGVCIVKHQVGVRETVIVDHYSEEFQTRYAAAYRDMNTELRLMRSVFDVDAIDIYPPHLNRWKNTHFYAFVCRPLTSVPAARLGCESSELAAAVSGCRG